MTPQAGDPLQKHLLAIGGFTKESGYGENGKAFVEDTEFLRHKLENTGRYLCDGAPYSVIFKHIQHNGRLYIIDVGWGSPEEAMLLEYVQQQDDWIDADWSVIPLPLLKKATDEIVEEAKQLIKAWEDFIDRECANEPYISKAIPSFADDDKCATFIEVVEARFQRMRTYLQENFPLPGTLQGFRIDKSFEVPMPEGIDERGWSASSHEVGIYVDSSGLHLGMSLSISLACAYDYLLAMPQIASFVSQLYHQLAHLAAWEKAELIQPEYMPTVFGNDGLRFIVKAAANGLSGNESIMISKDDDGSLQIHRIP
jgi:hypothetical protein